VLLLSYTRTFEKFGKYISNIDIILIRIFCGISKLSNVKIYNLKMFTIVKHYIYQSIT
jgi:hypothetical protein